MKAFFNLITTLAVRFRAITLALVVLILVLGLVAISQLKQELLPPIEFPSTVIIGQVSGLSSEQVLQILTEPLEAELAQIDALVNVESTTTGAFGSVIQTSNEFGLNQERVREQIQTAIDNIWLPVRRIAPPEGTDPEQFAADLLADLPPEILIYLHESDPNFLFQLSPAVWSALSPETARTTLAYLAAQVEETQASESFLANLVDQTIVPQIEALEPIARANVDGGQVLPGEDTALALAVEASDAPQRSVLLQLSTEAWNAAAGQAGIDAPLTENTAADLAAEAFTIPDAAPTLPESWQMDHFRDATDLLEMQTLTRSMAGVFDSLINNGRIVGAIGQTDDLTSETIEQMLAIDPTMLEYFEAEHLAAMSDEIFATLPDDYIANLDGFTRDELAAAALAQTITGVEAEPDPVTLPQAWRIQPPQIIAFSFDDLPLATYSVFGTFDPEAVADSDLLTDTPQATTPDSGEATEDTTSVQPTDDIPEGPPLPLAFNLLSLFLGTELNTADDLLNIAAPEQFAEQLGSETLSAADLLNFLMLLNDPPPGVDIPAVPVDPNTLIGAISADAISFIAEYDPAFLTNLTPAVFEAFSDEVLALPDVAPPLSDVWDTLAGQPQFRDMPLQDAEDLLNIGDGSAAVLNTINETVPERFAGYEVRLFDSLTPGIVRYFVQNEPDFYTNLDADVLLKFSPDTLAALPESALASLPEDTVTTLTAIAEGEQPSAAKALEDLYASDVPPGDPAAPPLNTEWALLEPFYNIELDTADDFFRFPDEFLFEDAAGLMNSIFNNPQGASFAPNLFGNMSVETISYILGRDPAAFNDVRIEVLQVLPEDGLALLPEAVQERVQSDTEPFTPTAFITRTNGASSLLVTVYKTSEANTVETFHLVDDLMREIDANNDDIEIVVALETASFVEDSINGVIRDGTLGAIFAFVIILLFLSGGVWSRGPRRRTALVIVAVFIIALVALVVSQWPAGGGINSALAAVDPVLGFLLLIGLVAGLAILLWPGDMPIPAWRSTLVTTVSIPLSILGALALMYWVPPFMNNLLSPLAGTSPIMDFIIRLFPANITLNILTLSGLTVAIGRVVDDSIVVLENIFREIQLGTDKRAAILSGTRDVSVAIFTATMIVVVVFLPLGLTGGIISEFFLPFGLAVTYALLSSFAVAISVVPTLAYILIRDEDVIGEDAGPIAGRVAKVYIPVLRWSLGIWTTRGVVLAVAVLSLVLSGFLFISRPQAFIPDVGEPEIAITAELPSSTRILETNELVRQMEQYIEETIPADELGNIRTSIGGGGFNLESLFGTSSVSENRGLINVSLQTQSSLDRWTQVLRTEAENIFGAENVTVSAASLADAGGFGGLELILSGPQDQLEELDPLIIETLNNIDGLVNVTSNLSAVDAGSDGPATYLRVDGQSAVSYNGDLETEDTLGVSRLAREAIEALDLPEGITVSEGFETQQQTEGFQGVIVAMGIALVIIVAILMVAFNSLIHWLTIILSVVVAPVGAAIALTLTGETLGVAALIGLLMLIGLVITNAVVLVDRVQSNRRERGMEIYDALVNAGDRRLRPILMTTLATIIALIPLAIGLSEGTIISSQLGIVVIGGVTSSMLLTLIVVPVAYRVLDPIHQRLSGLVGRGQR